MFSRELNQRLIKDWYDKYCRNMYNVALNVLKDPEEAEDVVADVFEKLLKKENDFSSIKEVPAYLTVCVRNVCFSRYRQQERQRDIANNYLYLIGQGAEIDTQNDIFTDPTVLDQLYKEIENLPEQCRKIFKLMLIEGMPVDEIATHLDLSEQTIRNQKAKAIKLLQSKVYKNGIPFLLLLISLFPEELGWLPEA
jgi:RNA polymerase sigma-70 factor (family 1)